MYRLIKKKEVKRVARLMADAFRDYPLYDTLFPNAKKKEKGIYYLCWYRIYTRQSYTKISDDFNELYCLKTPDDKENNALGLFFNPFFFFGLMRSLSIFTLKRLRAFLRLEKKYQKQFYHPERDNYLQVICIKKEKRNWMDSLTNLLTYLNETFASHPTYFETHTVQLEKLYKLFDAITLAKDNFYGCPHIIMTNKK